MLSSATMELISARWTFLDRSTGLTPDPLSRRISADIYSDVLILAGRAPGGPPEQGHTQTDVCLPCQLGSHLQLRVRLGVNYVLPCPVSTFSHPPSQTRSANPAWTSVSGTSWLPDPRPATP